VGYECEEAQDDCAKGEGLRQETQGQRMAEAWNLDWLQGWLFGREAKQKGTSMTTPDTDERFILGNSTLRICNRHMARLYGDLEDMGCPAAVFNAVKREFAWLRDDLLHAEKQR
jgi:hypothetical protein